MGNLNITVFGGSAPRPGEPAYQEAYQLGKLLAESGFNVLTGGYIGTMEAASRGAAEAGGHVIGLTCDEIEAWRPVAPNSWVKEEIRHATLRDRLNALIDLCDAAIALPGGIGTLAEIACMWSGMQTRSIPIRPLILVGAGWKQTLESLAATQNTYIVQDHYSLLTFTENAEAAFLALKKQRLNQSG